MSEAAAGERRCVVCHERYEGTERFCSIDGGAIVAIEADDLYVGRTIDHRYLVRRRIGRGGMGLVYEADHIGLDRRVAIKFVTGAADADTLARFRREARVASKIVHAHVVQIHDVGRDGDVDFLVMEYVEGHDLQHVLDAGRLDVVRAVAIAQQILAGLGAIHAAGIVHRDIKPANVMIATRDDIKIMDFGISRALRGSHAGTLTDTGKVVGTPQFMAPEQLFDEPVDQRADLYATGLVLYAMITGAPPYDGSTLDRLAALHADEAPLVLPPEVPAHIAAALTRVLAKQPRDRFADAREFAAALAGEAVEQPAARWLARTIPATPARKAEPVLVATPRRWRWPLIGAGAVCAVAVAAWLAHRELTERAVVVDAPRDTAPRIADADDVARRLTEARALEHDGKLELAVASYEAAVTIAPSAEQWFHLGELYERSGNKAAAAERFHRYLEAAPTAGDRDAVRARIATLEAPATASKPQGRSAGMRCDCASAAAHMTLCKTKHAPSCVCRNSRGATLCPEPYVQCPEGVHCPTTNAACPVPNAVISHVDGHRGGEPCEGFAPLWQATDSKRVAPRTDSEHGTYECTYCNSPRGEFRGTDRDRCEGYTSDTGTKFTGELVGCQP